MLKSTYKPSANLAAPAALPPGWTEHAAPSGHKYYYHAETKESTYKRPGVAAADVQPLPVSPQPPTPQLQLSDPRVANAFMAQHAAPTPGHRGGFSSGRGGRGGGDHRPRPQPVDKPRSKVAIPGCEPWVLVSTKYGRRFAYNPEKNASFWRIPEKLKAGILELDQARIREKVDGPTAKGSDPVGTEDAAKTPREAEAEAEVDYDSSEYEEVEVTDDEDAGEDGNPSKRQRTEEPDADQPVEFGEDDIAYQLQAMGGGYGLEGGEFEEDAAEDGQEDGGALSDDDARALFADLLDDFNINPYSPWEKLVEEGKIFDDARYTALSTMKARKDAWEDWSRSRIQALREQRAKEEKKDPRIAYMTFLQEHATPKLYWPEFKRKYKKEPPMKDAGLADKDREKWYRDYVNRLKLPQSTVRSDLTALLRSVPPAKLNNRTLASHLPPQILTDMRYVATDAATRERLVDAYITTLGPPPDDLEAAQKDEEAQKARAERERRETALRERERAVAEEKRNLQRRLAHGKAVLREEERELERAMEVGKRGLQTQLRRDEE